MKNIIALGKKIMFVSWNIHLSYSFYCFLEAMAIETNNKSHLICIHRPEVEKGYLIDPGTIWDAFCRFEPEIIVIDPIRISKSLYVNDDVYPDGLEIVRKFDKMVGDNFDQIIWTSLSIEGLSGLDNSFYFEQIIPFQPFYNYLFDGSELVYDRGQYLNQALKGTLPTFLNLLAKIARP